MIFFLKNQALSQKIKNNEINVIINEQTKLKSETTNQIYILPEKNHFHFNLETISFLAINLLINMNIIYYYEFPFKWKIIFSTFNGAIF